MQSDRLKDLGNRIHLIDGLDLGMPGRTGTYVIHEENLTLVETGPSPSVPHVLKGLSQLGHDPADVKFIIVTHIHLDHAGGVGLLLQDCPQAKVVVHPRGARHLARPSKLIAGARAVYGSKFDALFDPVVPVPEERLIVKEDGETLTIGPGRTLQFWHTPGHAAHHFSIYDPVSNGVFTGDTAGIRYHQTNDVGLEFYLPSTSPNQFDPEAMLTSIRTFQDNHVDRIYFGHYGMTSRVKKVYEQVSDWIPRFVEEGEKALENGEGTDGIVTRLTSLVSRYLTERGVPDHHRVYTVLKLDLHICALGIADYLQKREG